MNLIFFVFVFAVALLQNVSAAEIKLFGYYYPTYLLIPITIVLILWFTVVLAVILKKSQKFHGWLAKFHLSKIDKKKLKDLDMKYFLDQIVSIKAKVGVNRSRDLLEDFSKLARDYFYKNFKLRHTYTDSELLDILRRRGKCYVPFMRELIRLKYSHIKLTDKKLLNLIVQLEDLISPKVKTKTLLKELPVPKHASKTFGVVKQRSNEGSKEVVAISTARAELLMKQFSVIVEDKKRLNTLLKRCNRYISENKLKPAQKAFDSLKVIYDTLDAKEKATFKDRVETVQLQLLKLKRMSDKLESEEDKILNILERL